jgi:cardiolipin synthase
VRLLLPGRNNHPLAGAAARHGYDMLLEAGVEIWEWEGAMVHAKTVVVDEEISLVGSSNLDPLSLGRNYELNLLVVDPTTGHGMRAMFESDLGNARRLDLAAWERRPRWQRHAESAARIFARDL